MTIEEFKALLLDVETAVIKHGWDSPGYLDEDTCKRSDGKYVLEPICKKLGISYSGKTRWQLVRDIIHEESKRLLFTGSEIKSGLIVEMEREKCEFNPYKVSFTVNNEEADRKFRHLLKRAKSEFCSEADWLLEPLLVAVEGKGRRG